MEKNSEKWNSKIFRNLNHTGDLGAVSLTTQRTQRNELLHDKDRSTMYKMETFSFFFVCSPVKNVAAKNERHTLWTRDNFSYARRKRRIQFVQCTNTTTNHSITTSSPAKFDCTAQRGWTGNGNNPICARAITIRWNDAMWLVKPCVACMKLEHGFNSRVALRALRCLRNFYARSCVALSTLRAFYARPLRCVCCVVKETAPYAELML